MTKKKEVPPKYNISNCNFTGVHFDAKAVDAIQTIAEAYLETALGLKQLSQVLKASSVTIETLMKVG